MDYETEKKSLEKLNEDIDNIIRKISDVYKETYNQKERNVLCGRIQKYWFLKYKVEDLLSDYFDWVEEEGDE